MKVKSSQEILGLPILSIEEGKQIGSVRYLVLNPQWGNVEFLLVEDEKWYLGPKIMRFEAVQGIGETALTILNQSSLSTVAECAGAMDTLEKNLCLPGTKVLSNKGRFIGSVSEYYVNEQNGEITGCELIPVGGEKPAGIIPRNLILTYGSEFLVVEDGAGDKVVMELPEEKEAKTAAQEDKTSSNSARQTPKETKTAAPDNKPATGAAGQSPKTNEQPVEALKHFEEQQKQYILGKKVTMRIVGDNGEVVAEEGEAVTEEIIKRARATGKYIQLTLNTRD